MSLLSTVRLCVIASILLLAAFVSPTIHNVHAYSSNHDLVEPFTIYWTDTCTSLPPGNASWFLYVGSIGGNGFYRYQNRYSDQEGQLYSINGQRVVPSGYCDGNSHDWAIIYDAGSSYLYYDGTFTGFAFDGVQNNLDLTTYTITSNGTVSNVGTYPYSLFSPPTPTPITAASIISEPLNLFGAGAIALIIAIIPVTFIMFSTPIILKWAIYQFLVIADFISHKGRKISWGRTSYGKGFYTHD